MTNHGRRLDRLETLWSALPAGYSDEQLRRIAETYVVDHAPGLEVGAVVEEARKIIRSWHPTRGTSRTLESIAAEVAAQEGVPVDRLLAEARRAAIAAERRR